MDQNERYSVPNKSETDVFWLPVTHRIQYKIPTICSNSISGTAPLYLTDLFQPYTPARQLRSASYTRTFVTPLVNTKTSGERSFSYAGPIQRARKKGAPTYQRPCIIFVRSDRVCSQSGKQPYGDMSRGILQQTQLCATKPGPIIISLCVGCGP